MVLGRLTAVSHQCASKHRTVRMPRWQHGAKVTTVRVQCPILVNRTRQKRALPHHRLGSLQHHHHTYRCATQCSAVQCHTTANTRQCPLYPPRAVLRCSGTLCVYTNTIDPFPRGSRISRARAVKYSSTPMTRWGERA